jgi:hypothetical protein
VERDLDFARAEDFAKTFGKRYENFGRLLEDFAKTPGRLCEDSWKTLRRFREDFAKAPGRLCEDSGKTLRGLREACRRRASGDGSKFLEVSGFLGEDFWEIPLDFHIGCVSLPDEIRKLGGAEIRMKFENKSNFEGGAEIGMKILGIGWGGDRDENFRNRVGRRSG